MSWAEFLDEVEAWVWRREREEELMARHAVWVAAATWSKRGKTPQQLLGRRLGGDDGRDRKAALLTPGAEGWEEFARRFPGFDPSTVSPKQRFN